MTEEQRSLKDELFRSIHHLDYLWKVVEENNWQNEQWILDALDQLNEISVRN